MVEENFQMARKLLAEAEAEDYKQRYWEAKEALQEIYDVGKKVAANGTTENCVWFAGYALGSAARILNKNRLDKKEDAD